jgi:phosphoribosyl-AMP cyclohydrolase
VREVQQRGAGEIVLNCMAADGTRHGYDIEQLRCVRALCSVPLVASGGAGSMRALPSAFREAQVDAALAASVFHSGAIGIPSSSASCARRHRGATVNFTPADIERIDWDKGAGLVPAIVQHADSGSVLMLGYMNRAALAATLERGRVVFFSRSKQRLWEKGETSGNYLQLVELRARLRRRHAAAGALPAGPVCHTGTPAASAMSRSRPPRLELSARARTA